MMSKKKLTVDDILKTPHFEQSLVIAGNKGLSKTIEWVHIIDTTYSRNYVNGCELILTTGAGWKSENDPFIFLNQLIEKNVTALCIQLGEKFNHYRSVNDVPKQLIDIADANDFPLIVFPENYDCRFVDLIHNLHTLIISQNYKDYLEQEQFIHDLYLILLNPHEIKDILYFLYRYLDVNVAYFPEQEKPIFAPRVSSSRQQLIAELVDKMYQKRLGSMQRDNLSIALKNVSVCQKDMARLAIYSDKRQLSNYDFLILEKCTIGLAQEYFGNIYIQERNRQDRETWVKEWLSGQLSAQTVKQKLQEMDPYIDPAGCAICLINLSSPVTRQKIPREQILKIIGISRSFIEQQGFYLLSCIDKQSIALILLNKLEEHSWKPRLLNALSQINEIFSSSNMQHFNDGISFSVGKIYPALDQLINSCEDAKKTIYIQNKLNNQAILFYDDLHIYRIIMVMEKAGSLNDFIKDYLQPIIRSGNEPDTVLLKTLLALRDCYYNKIEAAKQLYISRQSLYQRISTLEELLGEDFISEPQKRICLEIALYGLEYMNTR